MKKLISLKNKKRKDLEKEYHELFNFKYSIMSAVYYCENIKKWEHILVWTLPAWKELYIYVK